MHLAFTTMDKEPLTNTYFATLLLTTMPQIPLQKNPPTFLFCLFLEFYESGKNSISMSLVNQREFTTLVQFSDMQVLVILRLLFELLANMY